MKKLTTVFVLAIAMLMQVQAQDPNPKVVSGLIAYDDGRYDEAIEKFNIALEKKELVKPNKLAKLYFNLSQSYMRALENPELSKKYPNAALLAVEHFKNAEVADANFKGKLKNQIELIKAGNQLWYGVFNSGAAAYNEEKYESSRDHFVVATELDKNSPLSHMMLGYSYFMLEDTMPAINSWRMATDTYAANPPDSANPNMSSCYLLLATMLNMQGETKEALTVVTQGREMFVGNEDLQRTELSIYQQHPELFKEAEEKFVAAISDNPEDGRLKLAYAALLQQDGQDDKALSLYKEVLTKEPRNIPANLQVGAFFVNLAAKLNEEKMNMDGDDEIAAKEVAIKENLKNAYPYIKLLNEEQPDEVEWVNQLVNITLYLDMEEEANNYIKQQQDIMAKQNGN